MSRFLSGLLDGFIDVFDLFDGAEDAHNIEASSIVRPILGLLGISLSVCGIVLSGIVVVITVVSGGAGSKETSNIDQVSDNSEKDKGSQKGQWGGSAWSIEANTKKSGGVILSNFEIFCVCRGAEAE